MKKQIISVLSILVGIGIIAKRVIKKVNKIQSMSDKHLDLFLMMNQWVKVKQEGKNVAEYFEKNNYKNIAIYGMSYAGETLVNELKDTNINIIYGIDKNANTIYTDIHVISAEDEFNDVDVIVVTAITFFDEIKKKILLKINCPIISLEDILYEL